VSELKHFIQNNKILNVEHLRAGVLLNVISVLPGQPRTKINVCKQKLIFKYLEVISVGYSDICRLLFHKILILEYSSLLTSLISEYPNTKYSQYPSDIRRISVNIREYPSNTYYYYYPSFMQYPYII
jgi:hypothetical protein